MDFEIKDNMLIICPESCKTALLQELSVQKQLVNVKFMDINEYRKNICFDYGTEAVCFLKKKLEPIRVENVREILDNLIYIDENKTYENKRLNQLVEYKKELKENGCLIYNSLFKSYLENKDVVVYGYGELDKFNQSLLYGNSVQVIPYLKKEKEYVLHEAETIDQEVEFVYNRISDLLYSGVDISHIFVLNAGTDYESYIKRFNRYYGFELYFETDDSISATAMGKEFLEKIDKLSKEELYEELVADASPTAQQLISLVNDYAEYDLKEIKEMIEADLRKKTKKKEKKENVVLCVENYSLFNKDDYVFLLGFNDKTPTMKLDTDYLTDNIRPLLGLNTSEELNRIEKNNMLAYLSGIDYLTLSYCKQTPFSRYGKSNLLDEMSHNIEVIKEDYTYSDAYNRIRYADQLDALRKFNKKADALEKLYELYDRNGYLEYDNQFNGLDENQKKDTDKVKLSYTSMNTFYECSFHYYLDHILKISDFEGSYMSRLGNVCHDVLKQAFDEGFDFDSAWKSSCEKNEINSSKQEEFFTGKIKEEMKNDIEIIRRQTNLGFLTQSKKEEEIYVNTTDKITFKGIVDKVLYKEQGNEIYATVVDYKTGKSADVNRRNMDVGLSLQLPSYLYLLKNYKEFKNKNLKYNGFYLQHILNSNLNYNEDKTAEEIKEESMKLDGFTSTEMDRIALMDPNFEEDKTSSVISHLKLTSKGTLDSRSRVADDTEIDALITLVENKIKESGQNIMDGNFRINPKTGHDSCRFCSYQNVCYVRNENYVLAEKEGMINELDDTAE